MKKRARLLMVMALALGAGTAAAAPPAPPRKVAAKPDPRKDARKKSTPAPPLPPPPPGTISPPGAGPSASPVVPPPPVTATAPRVEVAGTSSPLASPTADRADAPAPRSSAEPEPWHVSIDAFHGGSNLQVLSDNELSGREQRPTNTLDDARVSATSFVLGGAYDVSPALTLGVRVPVVTGSIVTRGEGIQERSARVIGNVGLGGRTTYALSRDADLVLGAELSVPTGGGQDQPLEEDVRADPRADRPFRAFYKYAVARAADRATASRDTGLFEMGRVGLSPAAGAVVRAGRITARPLAKLEGLVDVTGEAQDRFLVELVGGGGVGYRAHALLEPEVAAWGNVALTSQKTREANGVTLEPGARLHLGPVTGLVSVLVPVVGQLADARTLAFHAGARGQF